MIKFQCDNCHANITTRDVVYAFAPLNAGCLAAYMTKNFSGVKQ